MSLFFNINEYIATGVAARYVQGLLEPREVQLFEKRLDRYITLRQALLAEQLALEQRSQVSTPMPETAIWQRIAASLAQR